MKPCKCGCTEIELKEKPTLYRMSRPDAEYYYICTRCGFRTRGGISGQRIGGHNVTREQAIKFAAERWEEGYSYEQYRRELKADYLEQAFHVQLLNWERA